jgi:hypothetical protein
MTKEDAHSGSTFESSPDQAAIRDAIRAAATGSAIVCQPEDQELQALCDSALSLYGTRVLDNIDLERLPGLHARAGVMARAMMERGDASAFVLGRKILAMAGAASWR